MKSFIATVLTFCLLSSAVADDPKPPPAMRGRLPAHFSKIGLTAEQRLNIVMLDGKNKHEIELLQAKIDAMKEKQKADIAKMLTPFQHQALDQIYRDKNPYKIAAQQQAKK